MPVYLRLNGRYYGGEDGEAGEVGGAPTGGIGRYHGYGGARTFGRLIWQDAPHDVGCLRNAQSVWQRVADRHRAGCAGYGKPLLVEIEVS